MKEATPTQSHFLFMLTTLNDDVTNALVVKDICYLDKFRLICIQRCIYLSDELGDRIRTTIQSL